MCVDNLFYKSVEKMMKVHTYSKESCGKTVGNRWLSTAYHRQIHAFVMIFSTYVVTNNHVKRSIVVTEGKEGIIWTEKLKTH